MRTDIRRLAPALAITLGVALLAGCGSAADAGAYYPSEEASQDIQMVNDASGWAAESEMDPSDGSFDTVFGPQVIVYGNATVYSNDPVGAAERFEKHLVEIGGRVESTWITNQDPNKMASIYGAVPAEKYEEALAYLSTLGRTLDQSTSREDVGRQVTDLDARRASLESSIQRLEELMAQATTTEELLQAEDSLTQRRGELDSLNAQLEWLQDQIAMSSINVTFTDSPATAPGFTWAKAWDYVLKSFRYIAYALIILIPWALIGGVVAWIVVALTRRKSKQQANTNETRGEEERVAEEKKEGV